MPFRSAANAAAFFARRLPTLGRAVMKLKPSRVFPASFKRHRAFRHTMAGVDIGGGLAATGGFAAWEAKRIREADKERQLAVKKFRGRLENYEPPARRKKVPRIKKTS
jgi:hypothetical protein